MPADLAGVMLNVCSGLLAVKQVTITQKHCKINTWLVVTTDHKYSL